MASAAKARTDGPVLCAALRRVLALYAGCNRRTATATDVYVRFRQGWAGGSRLTQLGEQLGIVELEFVRYGGDFQVVQRGGRTKVGQECGVGGIAAGGHSQQ